MSKDSFMQKITQIYQELGQGRKLDSLSADEIKQVNEVLAQLDRGELRVCEKQDGKYVTHAWIKEAILIFFRLSKMSIIQAGDLQFYDKIPVKKWTGQEGVRAVPHAIARYGSFIESGVILMPSYVNIGARVGTGTMVDTWATVGSCAQIGKNVHLSGGVGIGGVLEPVQASPVVIEDNCFIGSRSIIVEGAHLEEGVVVGAGVTITASSKIIDVTGKQEVIHYGHVPSNSVVIPGSTTKSFPAGNYGVNCALIIGKRKQSTDLKTSLTEALRDHGVQA
jgi:2,3,4,5-tetrahydropyridine-2-carboxylate N-succinyltransferase